MSSNVSYFHNIQAIVRYLKSLKAVHMVSVAKELCPEEEYTEIFN